MIAYQVAEVQEGYDDLDQTPTYSTNIPGDSNRIEEEALNAQQVFLSEQPENSLRRPRTERQKSSNERDNVTSRAKKPGNFTSITP